MSPLAAPDRGDHRGAREGQPSLAPDGRRGGAGRGYRPTSPAQVTPTQTSPNEVPSVDRAPSSPCGHGHGAGQGGASDSPSSHGIPSPVTPGLPRGAWGRGPGRGQISSGSQATPTQLGQSATPRLGQGKKGNRGNKLGEAMLLPARVTDELRTICVRRPNYGTSGRQLQLQVNSFELTASDNDIYHYDAVSPDKLSYKRKFVLFQHLQDENPAIFTPKMVYDGQKMAYRTQPLDLGPENAGQFDVSFPRTAGSNLSRPPQVFNIKLTKVATIRTEILRRYVAGQQSWDEDVQTALMALNIAIRTEPNSNNPYRGRSFYNASDRQIIGGGLEVWRGVFQSVRPVIDRLVVNIDLSATVMYQEGLLLRVVNEFFHKPACVAPTYLTPGRNDFLPPAELARLKRFLNDLRIRVETTGARPRKITGLTSNGAKSEFFENRAGQRISVASYFVQLGHPLQYPGAICVKIGSQAMVPLEMCHVLRGQFASKVDMDPQQIAQVLQFATKKPAERMAAIKAGINHLQFTQSGYISQFGLTLKTEPLKVDARIINPPRMKYSGKGAQASLELKSGLGSWNMLDKKFGVPGKIRTWAIVSFEYRAKRKLKEIVKSFQEACGRVGIEFDHKDPVENDLNPQGNVANQLYSLGQECIKVYKSVPSLIVIILPEGASDLYVSVKKFGNITHGVATQCLRWRKCYPANSSYWSNVMLKINVKLGGINAIPESDVMNLMSDVANPTMVFGADVMHPAPHTQGRPSIAAVVGSVDVNLAKYTAATSVQQGGTEMIADLKDMCKCVLENYRSYRKHVEKKLAGVLNPQRLIFYRDGVSEGQFQIVKEQELPLIREACQELGMNPKITLIIVRKRHHNQMFPLNLKDADKSGNAPAGTVIDQGIAHPTEHDFFLQSHAGILGTSRPGFYSVLHDEIGFNADSIQSLSFALCHVYAPATRSVSIPAPVYYADKLCTNSKINFDDTVQLSDAASVSSGGVGITLEAYKKSFRPAHQNQRTRMYFV